MNEKPELKSSYVGAQVTKHEKLNLRRFCDLHDVTESQLVRKGLRLILQTEFADA